MKEVSNRMMLHLYGYSSHSTLDKALGENVTSMKVKVTGVLKSTNVIIFFFISRANKLFIL